MTSTKAVSSFRKLAPRNAKQRRYVDILTKDKPTVVIASGAPGCGKTLFATFIGAQKLHEGHVDKLVITRPNFSTGPDDIGFLPGDIQQKMEPWMMPIYDALTYYYPRTRVDQMVKERVIEIAPLRFMRGRTFESSWIICDEAQNTTVENMLMVLTRIGKKSKLVLTGDPDQHDRGFEVNGLNDLVSRMSTTDVLNDHFEYIEFTETDVERHPMIPLVLNMYKSR